MINKKFNQLTVIEYLGHKYGLHKNYKCLCDCGKYTEATYQQLKSGLKKSCGCIRKGINSTHKLSGTRFYRIWNSMIDRCYNKNNTSYKNYGGRGIMVCDFWKNSFQNFYNDMFIYYKDGLTIDRIDVNGNYSKDNCRFISVKEQNRNRRSNKFLTINGETKTISEWLEIVNLNSSTFYDRLRRGWSIENSLFTKVKRK